MPSKTRNPNSKYHGGTRHVDKVGRDSNSIERSYRCSQKGRALETPTFPLGLRGVSCISCVFMVSPYQKVCMHGTDDQPRSREPQASQRKVMTREKARSPARALITPPGSVLMGRTFDVSKTFWLLKTVRSPPLVG